MSQQSVSKISITLPNGNTQKYNVGTTALEIAQNIAPSLAKAAISCSINQTHCDLLQPIVENSTLTIYTMKDDTIALELIRHDCAHIMARAVQDLWPQTKVTIGPVIKNGWYYDFDRKEAFTLEDLKTIEKKMRDIIAQKDPIKCEIWPRQRAINHYRKTNEPYKVELVQTIPNDQKIRMYWHGHWQDLCRGPHLVNTGQVPKYCFKLVSIAGAYWRGNAKNSMLQRIYGIAFKNKTTLNHYLRQREEAEKRDHRKLAKKMDLFHLQPKAPGMVFWHPNGWNIYNALKDYIRRRQNEAGYHEISTPQLVDHILWRQSGHWSKYRQHMFIAEIDENHHANEKRTNALKPMNCPCHVQVYNQGIKSYRDLPIRLAEFGACHRYEPSGALHGLMRVRGFTQDDAHIFCTKEQIKSETAQFIALLSRIYTDLGFNKFDTRLSTRPENRVGSDAIWDIAENALKEAINALNLSYTIDQGEGAFYGPKLDFNLTDAMGRNWQCGTLQADFNLPERLKAEYIGEDGGKHRPVMLHRAIIGSFERFIGILLENYAGRLPLWLAPVQVMVATIVSDADDYALQVVKYMQNIGLRVKADLRREKINYKIREHSLTKIPIIAAVGRNEVKNHTLTLRRLGQKQTQVKPLKIALNELVEQAKPPDIA